MSSRVLKKLHGENELDLGINEEIDDEQSDIEPEINTGARKKQMNINRYDLLNPQSPSESEVKEDDNETENASTTNLANIHEKKKKKKRKKKSGKHVNRRSSEDNADMDDLAKTVREVDQLLGGNFVPNTSPLPVSMAVNKSLLSIQHKNLNPSYEMKRMFGSRVVQAEQNKRRNGRGQRSSIRSTWLVNPRDNWPTIGMTGLHMVLVKPPDDVASIPGLDRNAVYFAFEHTSSYKQVQQMFLDAVQSLEPKNIIQIIKMHPYHIDSLIQLSDICKMTEDHVMAAELIENALLALESSFHSMFSLTSGNCRLDYRRQENRALFIVLFKHSQNLENRACSRTALEIAKLILSLDKVNDPLAIILLIDYYAIRAKQYEWFIQLYNEWGKSNNLSQLPNMGYSYALALFLVGDARSTTAADKALQYALLMFPGVLKPLLDSLSVQVDSRVSTHSYFNSTTQSSESLALNHLMSLYVCRSKQIWRDAEILPWLEANVNVVLDMVDAKDEMVADFALKRTQRYKFLPRPILRHIVLSDFKEKVPLAQYIRSETEPILMYDPLPPHDSINTYARPAMVAPTANQDSSPLSLFFQSLFPTFNIQEGLPANRAVPDQNAAPEDPDNEGAVASYTDLRLSINAVVDAMRDFLTNIRVPERPNDADIDENESTEDEANDYLT